MKRTRSLTCGDKKKHASKKQARDAMLAYRRRTLKGLPINAEPYPCGDHWHWGHSRPSKNRGRK